MPIYLIFSSILPWKAQFMLSVADTFVPHRTGLASITLELRLLFIYLIYNILRRIIKFFFKHTPFIWIMKLKSMQI